MKHIARYLKGTKDKGLTMSPKRGQLGLNLFSDTYFVGPYNVEAKDDPMSVKNWSGILIIFGGVPILWIQSEIDILTLESSQEMRDLI